MMKLEMGKGRIAMEAVGPVIREVVGDVSVPVLRRLLLREELFDRTVRGVFMGGARVQEARCRDAGPTAPAQHSVLYALELVVRDQLNMHIQYNKYMFKYTLYVHIYTNTVEFFSF